MKSIFSGNANYFFVMILFVLSCSQKTEYNKLPFSKVEIYCACIESIHTNIGYLPSVTCTGPHMSPARFINPKLLWYSTSDSSIVNSFYRMFFESKYVSDTLMEGNDARFVVLMKKNDLIADTFVFRADDHSVFSYNEKYNFKYTFSVMDSIRKILKLDAINCDSRK